MWKPINSWQHYSMTRIYVGSLLIDPMSYRRLDFFFLCFLMKRKKRFDGGKCGFFFFFALRSETMKEKKKRGKKSLENVWIMRFRRRKNTLSRKTILRMLEDSSSRSATWKGVKRFQLLLLLLLPLHGPGVCHKFRTPSDYHKFLFPSRW